MHRLLLTMLLVMSALAASAAERWEVLPATPAPIHSERSGQADANGISIHYAVYGQGSPVILLHGGLANTDYWGNQIQALAPHHTVIVMDSRGHGRSTRDSRPYGYDLMADDVVALMDALKVPKADIVGWSDGGILGLDLAIRHPARVGKIFAFAANTVTSGVKDDVEKNPTFAAFIKRAGHEYEAYSATPKEYAAFVEQISKMWASQPNWTDAQLEAIVVPYACAFIVYMIFNPPFICFIILANMLSTIRIDDPDETIIRENRHFVVLMQHNHGQLLSLV
jgi:pimeloyl-ACP methyl ester carboxylesterase